MRRTMRRSSAAWRVGALAWLLAACSVYDVVPSNPSDGASGSGAAAVLGNSGGDRASPSSGASDAGPTPTSGTSGSSPAAGTVSGGSAGTSGDASAGGEAPLPEAGGAPGTGGAVDAAGAGGEANEGGAAPTGPSTYRYVKLVALTEQAGNVWSSVAELQVLTTGLSPLASTGWSIKADSEETSTENAPATYAIDGKASTYWHTHWTWGAADDAPLPHYLIVDLGSASVVTGFSYLPRQDNKTNGRIKDWAFYLSNDGTSWGNPVKTGAFPAGSALQTVAF